MPKSSAAAGSTDAQATTPSQPPRRYFTRQRRALSKQRKQQAATHASRHLNALSRRLPRHAKVGLYYDGFGEMPTQPIATWCIKHGYQAYLPIVGSLGATDKRLRFAPLSQHTLATARTRKHALGMQQPQPTHLLWAQALDVLICPLVAADLAGNRMGMGGGYYDRTLAYRQRGGRGKPLVIGWCYDFQLVARLQRQPWDVPLDGLITPSGVHWFL